MTLAGLISGGDETAYKVEDKQMLNTAKTKKLVIDLPPLFIKGANAVWKMLFEFRFLGMHIAEDLSLITNTTCYHQGTASALENQEKQPRGEAAGVDLVLLHWVVFWCTVLLRGMPAAQQRPGETFRGSLIPQKIPGRVASSSHDGTLMAEAGANCTLGAILGFSIFSRKLGHASQLHPRGTGNH